MSWAVAVCIDPTCVMAARERQRDKQQGVVTRRLSWPAVVLAGGVLLSLAANLAQAQSTAWGRIVAAVPPGAFLVAVSMIERRAARRPRCRCRLPGTRRRTAGTRRCWRRRGGPPPSTRTSTGSRSPATRSVPALGCPTRLPPSCCASSAPARASRRQSPAPPDPGCLPAPAGTLVHRRQAGCRRGVPAREYRAGGTRSVARSAARQAPRRRGSLPGRARRPRPAGTRPPGPRTARRRGGPPARCPGQRPGTVSRISRPFSRIREPAAMPHRQLIRTPIRVPADSGAPFSSGRAGHGDNKPSCALPDSYKRKAYKTIIRGPPQMRDVRQFLPSCPWPCIRSLTSTHPLVRARMLVPSRPREAVWPGEDRRARWLAVSEGRCGKGGRRGGKGARADSN